MLAAACHRMGIAMGTPTAPTDLLKMKKNKKIMQEWRQLQLLEKNKTVVNLGLRLRLMTKPLVNNECLMTKTLVIPSLNT